MARRPAASQLTASAHPGLPAQAGAAGAPGSFLEADGTCCLRVSLPSPPSQDIWCQVGLDKGILPGSWVKVIFLLAEFIATFFLIILEVLPIIPLASSEDRDK